MALVLFGIFYAAMVCATWLNIAFLVLAAALVVRFVRTGGLGMLRMMGGEPVAEGGHDHHH